MIAFSMNHEEFLCGLKGPRQENCLNESWVIIIMVVLENPQHINFFRLFSSIFNSLKNELHTIVIAHRPLATNHFVFYLISIKF